MSLTRYLVPLTTLMMYEQPDLTQRTAFNDPQMVLIRPENTVVMMKAEDVRAWLEPFLTRVTVSASLPAEIKHWAYQLLQELAP